MRPTRLLARAQLLLFTGTDCQLCDVMKHEIQTVARTHALDLATYNIRDDALPDVHQWRRKYQYDIPVLHLNGQEIFRHRLTAQDLIAKLEQTATRRE